MNVQRIIAKELQKRMDFYPAIAILGPRQVGKTTLAKEIAAKRSNALFLDLETEKDRSILRNPGLFLQQHRDRFIVMDEVQFVPEIFHSLRPEIDAARHAGRFLLLGSASGDLLRQRSESLAGRISYLELSPFVVNEIAPEGDLAKLQQLWLRGGFPNSLLAATDEQSFMWRHDFIQTFLMRDLASFGVRIAGETIYRFWRMLAHLHSHVFNASELGRSLGGASHRTVAKYVDILVDAMMLRRLEPYSGNLGKRLVKSPKLYIRDSGLLHSLLGITQDYDLQGHPIVGASWEGFVIEQIANNLPLGAQMMFYRTQAGAEIDLIIENGDKRVAVEIKFSQAPKVSRGFWQGISDLSIQKAYVIAPVSIAYPLSENVEVLPIQLFLQKLQAIR